MDIARKPNRPDPIVPPPDTLTEPEYFSVSQAAVLLGVSRVTVWRWISAGRLPAWKLGHRTVRVKRDDLNRLLIEGRSNGSPYPARPVRSPRGQGTKAVPKGIPGDTAHIVQFYETDQYLVVAVSRFLGAALRAGEAALILATPAHRLGIEQKLRSQGFDLEAARTDGRFLALEADEVLSKFMANGAPDPERFLDVIEPILDRAVEGGRRVRVFGEMVAVLAADGNYPAALRLEQLWNGLQSARPFALCCGYPIGDFAGDAFTALLHDVCAEHSEVLPAESFVELPTSTDQLRAVAMLQQKAQSLEAALKSERAARAAAEQALRSRDEFLSIAAHELKTPVTSLKGAAQLALRRLSRAGQLDPERVELALQTIVSQSDRLARLTGKLLDASRLDAGKIVLERGPADLTALAEQVIDATRGWSSRHRITLTAPDTLPAEIDALRMEQVLINLLENAVKFSPEGGAIEVSLSRSGADAAELAVTDRGMGIPPEKRAGLFERFHQAHRGGHRSGLGLGLYISRQIVELHGGEIRADFPPEGGTRMILRFPLSS